MWSTFSVSGDKGIDATVLLLQYMKGSDIKASNAIFSNMKKLSCFYNDLQVIFIKLQFELYD